MVSRAPDKTTLDTFILSVFESYALPMGRGPPNEPSYNDFWPLSQMLQLEHPYGKRRALTVISLETIIDPVICCSEIMAPTSTVEAKCFEHPEYARRQNRLDGATTLRSIQEIHRKSGNVDIRSLQVFTGIVTNEIAELYVHFCDLGVEGVYYSFYLKK
ncbi:hypothetical protein DTO217A2_8051 [Paecilomyces variotii]|nr:hypothetical protein DTO217A2_8051 [Paecilomyces variotii]